MRNAKLKSAANGNLDVMYVLDSFALLCYLAEEPGYEQVTVLLERAQATVYLSMINLGEVLYITEREQGVERAREVLGALEALPLQLLDASRLRVLAAAHIKANYPISYTDAFVVAAAQEFQAVIVTGDPEFKRVAHLAPIEWLST
jgi:predicted nucleic acid-binding protein